MSDDFSLTLKRQLQATAAEAFDAWVNPGKVKQWWGPGADDVNEDPSLEARVGGTYRVVTHARNGSSYTFSGQYRALVPGERVAFTWNVDGDHPSIVTATFEENAGGTNLTLRHDGLETKEQRDNCLDGWNGALDKLERFMNRWMNGRAESSESEAATL